MVGNLLLTERYWRGFISAFHWTLKQKPQLGCTPNNMRTEVKWKSLSCVQLFATAWTTQSAILQVRMLEWVAFPFSRGIFPTQGMNPSLMHCRRNHENKKTLITLLYNNCLTRTLYKDHTLSHLVLDTESHFFWWHKDAFPYLMFILLDMGQAQK